MSTKTKSAGIEKNIEIVREDLTAERAARSAAAWLAATHGFHGKIDTAILKAAKITKAKDDESKTKAIESILGLFSKPITEEHEVPHPIETGKTLKIKVKVGTEYLLDRKEIGAVIAMQMAKLGLSSSPLADLLKAEGFLGKAQASEAVLVKARGLDSDKIAELREKRGDLVLSHFKASPAKKAARKVA